MQQKNMGTRIRPWAVALAVAMGALLGMGTFRDVGPIGLKLTGWRWCRLDPNAVLFVGDIDVNDPNLIYNLSHDLFADFEPNEHIDWTVDQSPTHMIDANNIPGGAGGGGSLTAGPDPDISSPNDVSVDTNDFGLRGYDGVNQFVYAKKWKTFNIPVERPHNVPIAAGRATRSRCVIYNDSGFDFIITKIRGMSDTDNYDFNLFESASDTDISTGADTLIDLVECESDGTSGYYDEETTISHATIENNHYVIFEHSAGTANALLISVTGFYNADKD